ncbi:MAG: hypothetical protein K2K54_03305 [Lachnospiraceae bacterium]|nr:hypothetical protein [Lachnospiraceae bacterium]
MLNEERIILMTHMASYEEHEGKKNVAIGNYFRGDYIGFQVLKSIISASIAFVIVFGMFIFYDFEVFMQEIYKMDLIEFAKNVLIAYFVTVGGYAVVTYIVYFIRYNKVKKSLKCYYNNLKKLSGLYEK